MSPGHWWRDDALEGGREEPAGVRRCSLGWGVTPLHKAGRVVFGSQRWADIPRVGWGRQLHPAGLVTSGEAQHQ